MARLRCVLLLVGPGRRTVLAHRGHDRGARTLTWSRSRLRVVGADWTGRDVQRGTEFSVSLESRVIEYVPYARGGRGTCRTTVISPGAGGCCKRAYELVVAGSYLGRGRGRR